MIAQPLPTMQINQRGDSHLATLHVELPHATTGVLQRTVEYVSRDTLAMSRTAQPIVLATNMHGW